MCDFVFPPNDVCASLIARAADVYTALAVSEAMVTCICVYKLAPLLGPGGSLRANATACFNNTISPLCGVLFSSVRSITGAEVGHGQLITWLFCLRSFAFVWGAQLYVRRVIGKVSQGTTLRAPSPAPKTPQSRSYC
jgi:hypothetical protein